MIFRRVKKLLSLKRVIGKNRPGSFFKRDGKKNKPLTVEERVPVFVVGCGRSGTHFISDLMKNNPRIASFHLDDVGSVVADSFVEYCLWNDLPVDMEGFLLSRKNLIDSAGDEGRIYFEANPYLALSVIPLFERFQAKFIFIARKPEDTVNSHFIKGWYQDIPIISDADLAVGFQYDLKKPNHFFGRIVPRGKEYLRWIELTQIGRIAWMWNMINAKIVEQLDLLPDKLFLKVKLEELNYDQYLKINDFVGDFPPISEKEFARLRVRRPGKGPSHRTVSSWTQQETREFLEETKKARSLLGYV